MRQNMHHPHPCRANGQHSAPSQVVPGAGIAFVRTECSSRDSGPTWVGAVLGVCGLPVQGDRVTDAGSKGRRETIVLIQVLGKKRIRETRTRSREQTGSFGGNTHSWAYGCWGSWAGPRNWAGWKAAATAPEADTPCRRGGRWERARAGRTSCGLGSGATTVVRGWRGSAEVAVDSPTEEAQTIDGRASARWGSRGHYCRVQGQSHEQVV